MKNNFDVITFKKIVLNSKGKEEIKTELSNEIEQIWIDENKKRNLVNNYVMTLKNFQHTNDTVYVNGKLVEYKVILAKRIKPELQLDLKQIDNIELDGVDKTDHPDYANAYITRADYKGREMTEEELDCLNDEYGEFVHEKVLNL